MIVHHGFGPVFDEQSEVLILGSFPSVKSRELSFYYGNRQNRFWEMRFGFFREEKRESIQDKISFLKEKKIALWDIVSACTIVGSQDAKLQAVEISDLTEILSHCNLKVILLNGAKAYELFIKHYDLTVPICKMPSTSPANPRYDRDIWWDTLAKFIQKREEI